MLPARRSPWSALFADERGFTVLEALVAAAIITLAAFGGFTACKIVAGALVSSIAAANGAAALDATASRLHTDAASAFAVFVPASDMYGRLNRGQELDFFSQADDGRAIYWRYFYAAGAQTLRRFDYEPGGAAGVRDVLTGAIDPAAAYPPLKGVTRFVAAAVSADALADPARNVYAGIAAIFTRAPQALPVSYADPARGVPDAMGGNGIVAVTLATTAAARTVHLAAGAMATGFTVSGLPLWHAVVYRVDQTHRFLFGFAGKSHVFIRAHVDVSYDGWKSRVQWCDFNLLGEPDGLDPHDPHADFKADEPIEQSDSIFATCRARHPLPPLAGTAGYSADPGPTIPAPEPAPRCWTQPGPGGRCWPDAVPPDWAPPSPFPRETPPTAWCATHAASRVCSASDGRSSLE